MSLSESQEAPYPDEPLANYLQRVRIQLGLSQKEVAAQAQIHVQSLGKIERGQTETLHSKTRQGLADALQIPVKYLDALNKGLPVNITAAIQFCPSCWTPGTPPEPLWMHERAKFCFECGMALRNRCHSCSELVTSLRHRFCPYCGTPYKIAAPEA